MAIMRGLLVCCLSVLLLAACGGGGSSETAIHDRVTVTPAMGNVMVGQQIQLVAAITDATGNVLPGRVVTWASSNTVVATVNSMGLVVALGLGQATITATIEGQSADLQSGTAVVTTTTGLDFVTVSAGGNHTCGLTAVGTAYCWGNNSSGQLGNGTLANSATPVLVSGGLSFATVSAGGNHTCGLTSAGTAYCWGNDSSGQLGNGAMTNAATPIFVSNGQFATVSAGGNHTCGVTSAGTAYCWGNNTSGQLGNGTTTKSAIPVPVSGALSFLVQRGTSNSNAPWLSAGGSHTCAAAMTPAGVTIFCWGDNSSGQLGNGSLVNSSVPVAIIVDPTSVVFSWGGLTAGSHHTCADARRGNFGGNFVVSFCWGDNSSGQLGDGTTTNRVAPREVGVFLHGLSAGELYTCAVGGDFTFCWGNNGAGQLGDGTMGNSATPVPVSGGLIFAVISTGGRHACGVTRSYQIGSPAAAGAVYCWGDNTFGQLGNSWTMTNSVPVNVAGAR